MDRIFQEHSVLLQDLGGVDGMGHGQGFFKHNYRSKTRNLDIKDPALSTENRALRPVESQGMHSILLV